MGKAAHAAWMDFAGLESLMVIYLAFLGACLGSFAYVLVERLPRLESMISPPSHCDSCGIQLFWYDNIPLFSYLWLGGRCRTCGASYARRSWLTELMGAGLLSALYLQYGLTTPFWLWGPILPLLLAIAWLDIDYWWIPNVLIGPGMVWFLLVHGLTYSSKWALLEIFLGILPAMLLWTVGAVYQRLRQQEVLGGGDIKLLLWLGLGLGMEATWYALVWACWQGVWISLWLRWRRQQHENKWQAGQIPKALEEDKDWQPPPHAIPFGPFLLLATLQVVLLPDWFVRWPKQLHKAWLLGLLESVPM